MTDTTAQDLQNTTIKGDLDPLACLKQNPPDFAEIRGRFVADVDNTFTQGKRRFAVFFWQDGRFFRAYERDS